MSKTAIYANAAKESKRAPILERTAVQYNGFTKESATRSQLHKFSLLPHTSRTALSMRGYECQLAKTRSAIGRSPIAMMSKNKRCDL